MRDADDGPGRRPIHPASSDVHRGHHDWAGESSLSVTLMDVIAAAGGNPVELEPLNERFDVDALETLFAPRSDGSPRTRGYVQFALDGYHVTVHSDGLISVRPPVG